MSTAPLLRVVSVDCAPERAYTVFIEQLSHWWPLADHGLFGADASLAVEGDLIVERSLDGRSAVWARVLERRPPELLRFSWHPGREEIDAGQVTVRFLPEGDGTRVELRHDGWERFADAADRRRPYVGPNAWGYVLEHLAHLVELADPGLVSSTRASYQRFFATAATSDFGPADDGGWDARQVVAHVALNDQAMAGVARELIHRQEPRFENLVCQDRAVLDAWIGSDDLPRLVDRGRAAAEAALALASRLDAEQLATPVHCRLYHDGELVLDRALPWGEVALQIQAGRHLPAHAEQLRKLRLDP